MRVDAAFVNDEHTYIFSGDQYVKYTGSDYDFVDEGYPKAIKANNLSKENLGLQATDFQHNIDAAFKGIDGNIYLFKGKEFLSKQQRKWKNVGH